LLDLAFGRCVPHGFAARGELLQPVIALDLAHQDFLALVVATVAGHAAVEPNAVGQDVHVLVFGVGVAGDDELVVVESHTAQILLGDLPPLLVGELFAGGGG
jgi:hypothetical protein